MITLFQITFIALVELISCSAMISHLQSTTNSSQIDNSTVTIIPDFKLRPVTYFIIFIIFLVSSALVTLIICFPCSKSVRLDDNVDSAIVPLDPDQDIECANETTSIL